MIMKCYEAPQVLNAVVDINFSLQGIPTPSHQFRSNEVAVDLESIGGVPGSIVSLETAEIGLIYSALQGASRQFQTKSTHSSSILLALSDFIDTELREFSRLCNEIGRRVWTPESEWNVDSLTQQAAVLMLRKPVNGLKILFSLCAEIQKFGDQNQVVFNPLYLYAVSGDPTVSLYATRISNCLLGPYKRMLNTWLMNGSVDPKWPDFFVHQRVQGNYDPSAFELKVEMVPKQISEAEAEEVFHYGLTIGVLRRFCHKHEVSSNSLDWSDKQLQPSVQFPYPTNYVKQLLRESYMIDLEIESHLQVIQDFVVLVRGDFLSLLEQEANKKLQMHWQSVSQYDLEEVLSTALNEVKAPELALRHLTVRVEAERADDTAARGLRIGYSARGNIALELFLGSSKRVLFPETFVLLWREQQNVRLLQELHEHWQDITLISFEGESRPESERRMRILETVHSGYIFFGLVVHELLQGVLELGIKPSWDLMLQKLKNTDLYASDLFSLYPNCITSIVEDSVFGGVASEGGGPNGYETQTFGFHIGELTAYIVAFCEASHVALHALSHPDPRSEDDLEKAVDNLQSMHNYGMAVLEMFIVSLSKTGTQASDDTATKFRSLMSCLSRN